MQLLLQGAVSGRDGVVVLVVDSMLAVHRGYRAQRLVQVEKLLLSDFHLGDAGRGRSCDDIKQFLQRRC